MPSRKVHPMFQNDFPTLESRFAGALALFETALVGEDALEVLRGLEQPWHDDQVEQDRLWNSLHFELTRLAATPIASPQDRWVAILCDRLARLIDGDPEIEPDLWRLALPPARPDEDAVTALLRRATDLACAWLRLCEPA